MTISLAFRFLYALTNENSLTVFWIRSDILSKSLAESNADNSPVKIWSVKSLPGEKGLSFLSPQQYYIT